MVRVRSAAVPGDLDGPCVSRRCHGGCRHDANETHECSMSVAPSRSPANPPAPPYRPRRHRPRLIGTALPAPPSPASRHRPRRHRPRLTGTALPAPPVPPGFGIEVGPRRLPAMRSRGRPIYMTTSSHCDLNSSLLFSSPLFSLSQTQIWKGGLRAGRWIVSGRSSIWHPWRAAGHKPSTRSPPGGLAAGGLACRPALGPIADHHRHRANRLVFAPTAPTRT